MFNRLYTTFNLRSLLLLCFIFIWSVSFAYAGSTETASKKSGYTFGVFPFLTISTIEEIFAPIASELSHAIDRDVLLKSTDTFEKFMQNLEQQEYDIAFIQPFDYVNIAKKAGYLPVATRNEPLTADFLVLEKSPLKEGKELKGKVIGLPPKVAAVSYLANISLIQLGLDIRHDVKFRHFSSHQSCMQQLLIGDIDVCVASRPVLRAFESQMNVKFRAIMTTPSITQTLFVVHSRVPEKERNLIKKTILSTTLSDVKPEFKIIFKSVNNRFFRPVDDAEYDQVLIYKRLLEKYGE